MKKIYVFAIGGSGARILRSLTMLLAAGVDPKADIVPIIIDPDQGAGNLTETVDILKRYAEIRAKANTDVGELTTFATSIETLPGQDYIIPLENVSNTKFEDYIGLYAGMSEASKSLVSTLFSPENLDLDMEVGFKGNPNIGSIVLGQFENSKIFKDFVSDFSQNSGADKRIFIISSIFGGTGASGFPTFLKSLRTNSTIIKDAHIGALSLQPYFAVQNDPNSAIDSSTFYSKTRAALNYYIENIIRNNDINDFYFIGDTMPETLENHEGGQDQKNKAHFVEMAGALSIIDFALKPAINTDNVNRTSNMYEFGIEGDEKTDRITFKSLGNTTEELIARPLTAFYLMKRYLENNDIRIDKDAWLKKIQDNLDEGFICELENFLEDYEAWLQEMEETQGRKFAPIKLDQPINNLFDCVEGYPVSIGFIDRLKKQNFDLYKNNLNNDSKGNEPENVGELLNLLSDVSYDLCSDKINLP